MLIEIFVSIAAIAAALYFYFTWRNDVFKRLGIPGPKPKLVFGNMDELFGEGKVPPLTLQQWTKEYGSVYGFYEGGLPVMVVSDPDILQEILVKQFQNFNGRKEFAIQSNPESGGDRVHMFVARGPKWKRLRMISNPTFTSAKIRQMLPKIHDCIDEMMRVLEKKHQEGKSLDIYAVYQGLTLDVIARVAFAYETSVQTEPDSELLRFCNAIFRPRKSSVFFLACLFPSIRRSLYYYVRLRGLFVKSDWDFLRDRVGKIIEVKRKQKASGLQAAVDFIQLMLDAEADPNEIAMETKNGATTGSKDTEVKKKLTPGEIASQSFLFILAGFETTSTALGFTTYLLATNPKVQEQLLEEIDERIAKAEDINYDTVQKLPYLECVVQEALRMYPLAGPAVSRHTKEACTIKGVQFPAGIDVLADVWSLHYNEDLWGPDVNEFKPDRFMSKSLPHPYAYMPFGAGPRICIGMRFALLEMKVALCTILKRYRIVECPETEKPLQLRYSFITLAPKNGVQVKLELRGEH